MAAFETHHPVVPAVYLLFALVLTMVSLQPVLIGISLIGAFAYGVASRGWRACLSSLRWQLPMVALIALFNPLFSASGATELFHLGPRAIYLESLCYGAAMGALFVASLLWFQAASDMLSFDKVMALFGNAAPTLALMISMCMRMIPRVMRRGRQVATTRATICAAEAWPAGGVDLKDDAGAGKAAAAVGARTNDGVEVTETVAAGAKAARAEISASEPGPAARTVGISSKAKERLRQMHVLMGWSMEDSLETADAMRARGWGAGVKRTTYTRFTFSDADAACVMLLVLGGLLCCVVAYAATTQYAFYPTMPRLVAWWGYAPYCCWMLLPALILLSDKRRFS